MSLHITSCDNHEVTAIVEDRRRGSKGVCVEEKRKKRRDKKGLRVEKTRR